jgi:acetyltransferase
VLNYVQRMATRPDPRRLTRDWKLSDGTVVSIRPIRPEDAAIERDFVNSLSDESRYYRFMYALKEITPEMLNRFTRIDYDREMALIAVVGRPPRETQIGVARYSTLPDGKTCEFAVVVADEWHGRGIATQLVRPLIDHARGKGLSRMEGFVLFENRNMLEFAKGAGFRVAADPEDPSVAIVTLDL